MAHQGELISKELGHQHISDLQDAKKNIINLSSNPHYRAWAYGRGMPIISTSSPELTTAGIAMQYLCFHKEVLFSHPTLLQDIFNVTLNAKLPTISNAHFVSLKDSFRYLSAVLGFFVYTNNEVEKEPPFSDPSYARTLGDAILLVLKKADTLAQNILNLKTKYRRTIAYQYAFALNGICTDPFFSWLRPEQRAEIIALAIPMLQFFKETQVSAERKEKFKSYVGQIEKACAAVAPSSVPVAASTSSVHPIKPETPAVLAEPSAVTPELNTRIRQGAEELGIDPNNFNLLSLFYDLHPQPDAAVSAQLAFAEELPEACPYRKDFTDLYQNRGEWTFLADAEDLLSKMREKYPDNIFLQPEHQEDVKKFIDKLKKQSEVQAATPLAVRVDSQTPAQTVFWKESGEPQPSSSSPDNASEKSF